MIRIVIAKRDRLMRECLKEVMILNGYEILCTCETGEELVEAAILHKPELVLCGYSFVDMDCIDAIKKIKSVESSIRYMIFVYNKRIVKLDIDLVSQANACIDSSCSLMELLECIKSVLSGENNFRNITNSIKPNDLLPIKLSKREREILKKISEYKGTTQIAEELHISIVTVNNHKANVVRKLKLRGHNALLEFAIALGN
jgi:DNA-binding NarL/FixJ family response regulator